MKNLPVQISTLDLERNGKNGMSNIAKQRYTLEEALEECGDGKYHWFIFLATGLTLAGVIVEGMFVGFVLPLAKCEISVTVTEQGFLNTTAYLGIVLGSYFWGFLADVKGRKTCLRAGLLGGFIFSFISCFSINAVMLIITRLLVGIFVAGNQATPMAYLGEFYAQNIRTKKLSKVAMFLPSALIYIPLLGWLFTPMEWRYQFGESFIFGPWRLFGLILSLVGFVALILMHFAPESPKFLLSAGRYEEAIKVLETLYHYNTGNPRESFKCRDIYMDDEETTTGKMSFSLLWSQTKPLFVPPYLKNTVKCVLLMAMLFSIAHGAFLWLPVIFSALGDRIDDALTICSGVKLGPLETLSHLTEGNSTEIESCVLNTNPLPQIIILITSVVFTVLYYFLGDIIKCVGSKRLMFSWCIATGLAGVGLIWINNFYAIAFTVIVFVSIGNVAGVLSAISVDYFPTKYRGMAMCIIMMAGRLGAIAGSNLSGSLLYTPECNAIFIIFSSMTIACMLLILLLPKSVD